MVKEEDGPLNSFGVSLIPPKFSIANATPSEIAELKKTCPSKILFKREVAYRIQACKAVPLFRSEEAEGAKEGSQEKQILHSKEVANIIP